MRRTFAFLGVSLFTVNAFGLTADMKEVTANGTEIQFFAAHNVTLTLDKSGRKVSMRLSQTDAGKPTGSWQFDKAEVSRDFCGTVRYRAKKDGAMLTLVDYEHQFCRFKQSSYRWKATLEMKKAAPRYFVGDPKKAADKPDCSEYAGQACIMLFMPATCSARNVTAKGSNSCFAELALKAQLCEAGVDMKSVGDDEIVCSVEAVHVCPTFMCAAPPPNCHYGAPFPTDENGCSTSCGTVICDSDSATGEK